MANELIIVDGPVPSEIQIVNCPPIVLVNGQPPVVFEISGSGPAGPAGPEGPQGEPGPAGPGGGSYFHTQMSADTVWTITHNLGYRPSFTSFDSTNEEVRGAASYPDLNTLVITYAVPISGYVALS